MIHLKIFEKLSGMLAVKIEFQCWSSTTVDFKQLKCINFMISPLIFITSSRYIFVVFYSLASTLLVKYSLAQERPKEMLFISVFYFICFVLFSGSCLDEPVWCFLKVLSKPLN